MKYRAKSILRWPSVSSPWPTYRFLTRIVIEARHLHHREDNSFQIFRSRPQRSVKLCKPPSRYTDSKRLMGPPIQTLPGHSRAQAAHQTGTTSPGMPYSHGNRLPQRHLLCISRFIVSFSVLKERNMAPTETLCARIRLPLPVIRHRSESRIWWHERNAYFGPSQCCSPGIRVNDRLMY